MECPYCNTTWHGKDSQFCPKCGKFSAVYDYNQLISNKQKIWIIVSGFLCYVVLFYLFDYMHIINLPFSNELYLGLAASLFMTYRLFFFYADTKDDSLKDFFPHWKEFLLIVGIGIYISAIVLEIIVEYLAVVKPINYGVFTVQYFIGFALGMLLMAYYYHISDRMGHRVKKMI